MKPSILITDGEQRSALAIVRSLGRAGYVPLVCSTSGHSLAGASRYCAVDEAVPDPLSHEPEYLDRLGEICERRNVTFLIPTTDAASVATLPARHRFAGTEVLGPEAESFARISDKWAVAAVARSVGIAVPRAVSVESRPSGAGPELDSLRFPVAIKATRSVVGDAGRRIRSSVAYARTASDAVRVLQGSPAGAFPYIVQEMIEGPGVGLFVLQWNGETLAGFAHRRIREKPLSGGVSVYRQSIPMDEELFRRCDELLRAHAWQGVAMVEFKYCRRSGVPYLLEVNGRFWGSLQLAIDAGVDFPVLLVDAAMGHPRPPRPEYRAGVRLRWFWGDVDHSIALLREGSASSFGARALAILRVFRPSRRGDRWEVLRAGDPIPFLRETAQWFSSVLEGRRDRRRAQSL